MTETLIYDLTQKELLIAVQKYLVSSLFPKDSKRTSAEQLKIAQIAQANKLEISCMNAPAFEYDHVKLIIEKEHVIG